MASDLDNKILNRLYIFNSKLWNRTRRISFSFCELEILRYVFHFQLVFFSSYTSDFYFIACFFCPTQYFSLFTTVFFIHHCIIELHEMFSPLLVVFVYKYLLFPHPIWTISISSIDFMILPCGLSFQQNHLLNRRKGWRKKTQSIVSLLLARVFNPACLVK